MVVPWVYSTICTFQLSIGVQSWTELWLVRMIGMVLCGHMMTQRKNGSHLLLFWGLIRPLWTSGGLQMALSSLWHLQPNVFQFLITKGIRIGGSPRWSRSTRAQSLLLLGIPTPNYSPLGLQTSNAGCFQRMCQILIHPRTQAPSQTQKPSGSHTSTSPVKGGCIT